jgi:hypothetical protein
MNLQRQDFLLAAPPAGLAVSNTRSAASIADFPTFGRTHPSDLNRRYRVPALPNGASNFNQLVGDYSNPTL